MYLQTEDYLLPCLNKKLFGVDCLGCGFQRAFLFLLKGDFAEAFKMYPAIYTLIILAVFALLHWKYTFKNGRKIILTLASINVLIIVISYFIKMNQLF
ncbi:hypothetical protein KCTC32516_01816 [Polaribacter huanghezhanensis]|uniref:DUF2752 domain-containing protein n=1 Tax=Polaribacter huanghezhanensis TaxID=1354726 RepID=UPI002649C4D2|nr:DUF2752 domain-containing protein [Polaribacter huanghezhanensis]WKD86441.1 hypothetical protein KCTC32516_01816 [Polaribacter huanghezhanensis]